MSKRYQLVKAIAARLGEIQIEKGYSTDAGLSLFLGEIPMFGESDPPAAMAVMVGNDVIVSNKENVVSEVPWEVQALVKVGTQSPLLALDAMVADIKRALELEDRTFGGLAVRETFMRGQTRVLEREPGSNFVGVGVSYKIMLAEFWGQP